MGEACVGAEGCIGESRQLGLRTRTKVHSLAGESSVFIACHMGGVSFNPLMSAVVHMLYQSCCKV